MLKRLRFFVFFLSIAGCIEPYEFKIHEPSPSLVIEASISDKSFTETLSYPSDGRYFSVKLTETGDVTNSRPEPVSDATVELLSSEGQAWSYSNTDRGLYSLLDEEFHARPGVRYQLRILLQNEDRYESEWESLPETDIPPMGEIGFKEAKKQVYVMEYPEWVLQNKQIVSTRISIPENLTGETIHYRWTYSPTWVYVAPLTLRSDPHRTCWATDPYYFNTYGLQADQQGGYAKDLFDFFTIRNERIFEKLSVLITQHAMTEGYYNFWREMKEQIEGSALIDTPPYNLKSNFSSSSGKKVSGYFGVTSEQAKRWYFDKTELSYDVPNTLLGDCQVVYGPGPPAPECSDCRAYSFGDATTIKPVWWED